MAKYTRHGIPAQYGGGSMHVIYRHPKGSWPRERAVALSREGTLRLKILEYAKDHSVAATCRHFGIAPSTYYRWKDRYHDGRLITLENRSSRPLQTRLPTLDLCPSHRRSGTAKPVSTYGQRQTDGAPSAAGHRPICLHGGPYLDLSPLDSPVD